MNGFFVEQFVFGLKIHLSLWYHFFIGAKFLFLKYSFEVFKQPVVTGGRIWRIGWGCRSNSNCNSCSFAIIVINLLCGALSWWKSTFSSFVAVFWWFLPSNTSIIIIIIMLCHLHGYPWPSLATSPYRSSPLAGLQGYIPYPHIAAECMFELVVMLLPGHMWGSIGVHHLWARPCFSSSVLHVWFV